MDLQAHPFFQDVEAAPAEAALQAKPAEPAPQVILQDIPMLLESFSG